MFSLQTKTALVTGGASGIGLAIAKAFAGAGAHVHILDLNGEQADQAARAIRDGGGQATSHAVDVSDQAQTIDVIGQIAGQGPIQAGLWVFYGKASVGGWIERVSEGANQTLSIEFDDGGVDGR